MNTKCKIRLLIVAFYYHTAVARLGAPLSRLLEDALYKFPERMNE